MIENRHSVQTNHIYMGFFIWNFVHSFQVFHLSMRSTGSFNAFVLTHLYFITQNALGVLTLIFFHVHFFA